MKVRPFLCRNRSGAATVEMAIATPIIVFLIVIGVDFARVYYFSQTVSNAARSGAIYGTAHPDNVADTDGITKHVLAESTNLAPAPTVTTANGADESGNPYLRVTVNWEFNTVVNYPGVPATVVLARSVQMRVRPAHPKEPNY